MLRAAQDGCPLEVLLWGLVRDLARWTAVSRGFRAAAGEAWTAAARRLGGAASGLPTDPVRRRAIEYGL